jgi:hypothetical protein
MKSRKPRYRRHDDIRDDDLIEEDRPRRNRPVKKEPRKRRKLPWLLLFAVALVVFLPTIVAKSPLRNVVLSAALPTKALRVSVGNATLGWFTRPSLDQVKVWDAKGNELMTAEAIHIDRAPSSLLFDWHNLGTIEVVRPALHLQLRNDGSNVDDVIQRVLAEVAKDNETRPVGDANSQPTAVAIHVVDGAIFAEDATTGRRWHVQSINLNYDLPGTKNGLGQGQLSGQIADIGANNTVVGAPGQFAVDLKTDGADKQQLTLQAAGLSLGLADAWLRRLVTGTELSGTLSGQGSATWTARGSTLPTDLTSNGTLSIDRLDMTAPILKGDRIRLARVELPWRLSAQPGGIVLDDAQVRCDIGQLAVRGKIVPQAIAQSDLDARGSVELFRLAAMLPHALRIRNDTTITSGTIQLTARTQPADGGELLSGSLQTAHLAGTSSGRPIRWNQPVSAIFSIRRKQGGYQLDALKCDSDFLTVDASGTPQRLTASARFDLDRLAEHLGQFIDLSGVELAGTGTAKFDMQQTAADQLSAVATGELAQLRVAMGTRRFSTSQATFGANIRKAGDSIDVSDAKINLDELHAISPGWNVNEPRAELAGNLQVNRVTGEIAADSAQLVTSAVSMAAKDVRYRPPQPSAGQPGLGQLTGMAAYRTDIARLAAWRTAPQQPPAYRPSGELTGQIRFAQQGSQLTGELNSTGQNLALTQFQVAPGKAAGADRTIWHEPQLTLRTLIAYDSPADQLTFEQLQIQSNTLQAAATGKIDKLSTAADVQINGTLNYDLAQITRLLKPYLGDGIRLVGREQAQFALAGPLNDNSGIAAQPASFSPNSATRDTSSWSRRVRGQLQLPWSGAKVYGLPIGAGKLSAVLGDGAIRVEPLALAVGEGQLTVTPNIRLDPPPPELTLQRGPLITNVRISPEVSNSMLKFVAPVLAGATQSEGLFSMALEGARVPLDVPKRADASGQLTVHAVRVVPGPIAQQWIGLAQQIEALATRRDPASGNRRQVTLLSVKDQQVDFRVIDGRVYHQNMEFQVGDVMLRSQGSVGFDETVALTLTVPIQDAWVANEPLLSGLRGQALQIPISGTLTRPQMDKRAISSLTQQLLQGAAQQAIGGELNKALDKLFKPRK